MAVFFWTESETSETTNNIIYEYDADGSITFTQDHCGFISLALFDTKPLENDSSEHRIVIEKDIGYDDYEDLLVGSVFSLDENGEPTSISDAIYSEDPIDIYMHVTLTDGDGREPIGIINDGTSSMGVSAVFRQTEDPDSAILTSIDDMSWRVTVRKNDNTVYDIVVVSFTEGVSTFNYTTTFDPAVCTINEDDFEIIEIGGNEYKINIVGNVTFKVFREL